ncbi:MAG: ShlB/FhaC/HecB family hemolysin secretion/activation protein, partial [Comamonadaceae bacterium]
MLLGAVSPTRAQTPATAPMPMPSPLPAQPPVGAAMPALRASATTTELLPTESPCTTCGRPLAQAANAQTLPEPPAPEATFRLTEIRLSGAAAIGPDELKALTDPYIGRNVALADLQALAAAITARYRERGYFLAQAVVPVQTVRDGTVEISVIEGRLGSVTLSVAPDASISEARVRGFLAPVPAGQAVNAPSYERAMLLLSDQPGVRATSALQEGVQVGTTDLTVEVAAAPRFQFSAEADNHGTLESGRYRIGGSARWNSPTGIGDNLDARVMVSNSNALQFGRIAYEAPLGTDGLRAGVGLARVNYELGGEFVDLGAQGTANVLDLSLNYPLIRQRQHNLFLRLGADAKQLKDEFTAFDTRSNKRVRGLGLGWTWERRDGALGGGYWASSGTLYRGTLGLRGDSYLLDQGLLVPGLVGSRTAGAFSKLSFQLSRLQAIVAGHSLYLAMGGQFASKNLDASEKLALGGARAVRAYATSEVLVDQGLIGNIEWRWSVNDELTPFVFYDAARGESMRRPIAFDGSGNRQSLRGYGVGGVVEHEGREFVVDRP